MPEAPIAVSTPTDGVAATRIKPVERVLGLLQALFPSVQTRQNGKSKSSPRQRTTLPRILVVEANPSYRAVISNVVEIAGGQFESVAELDTAKKQLADHKAYDMVIIGTSTEAPLTPEQVKRLRATAQAPLIVMAEAYDETRETLEVYQAGADQILPKPFVPDLLVGAIKSVMRQPGPVSLVPLATRIELGPIVFDAERRTVSGKGVGDSRFTKREWQLLAFFLASPNQFFKAPDAAVQAWGPGTSMDQFRGYVARIRKKLAPFARYCRLVTEKAKGYCLVVQHQS